MGCRGRCGQSRLCLLAMDGHRECYSQVTDLVELGAPKSTLNAPSALNDAEPRTFGQVGTLALWHGGGR